MTFSLAGASTINNKINIKNFIVEMGTPVSD